VAEAAPRGFPQEQDRAARMWQMFNGLLVCVCFMSLSDYKGMIFGQHTTRKTAKLFPKTENFSAKENPKVFQNGKLLL